MAGTVIEALRRFLPFLAGDPPLSLDQERALWAIERCRTSALGGEVYACTRCGEQHFACHSCNHKACPQCGRQATREWVERELDKRICASYFMVNFTLPSELRKFFFGPTASQAFNAFFKASSAALAQVLAHHKGMGATVNGFTGVLHTWNQRLLFHPHLHYLVPGAGLNAKGQLVRCRHPDFLVPVSRLRGAFVQQWREQIRELNWKVGPAVWKKTWGVHIQSFGTGAQAIQYLGAYVCRTAIGDKRILEITQDSVLFSWKDRSDGNKAKTCRLEGVEFVQRYLRHVLPKGLRSIRYYGFCHPAARKNRLRVQFYSGKPLIVGEDPKGSSRSNEEGQPCRCQRCGIAMRRILSVRRDGKTRRYPQRAPPLASPRKASA